MNALLRNLKSTTGRIAVTFFIAQAVSVGAALLFMNGLTRTVIDRGAEDYALELRADISDSFRDRGIAGAAAAVGQRLEAFARRDAVIALARPDGTLVAGNLPRWPEEIGRTHRWQTLRLRRAGAGDSELMGVMAADLPQGYRLLTGQVMEDEDRLTQASEVAFLSALGAGLVLALIASFGFARAIARRIARIAATAETVATGDLSQRVVHDGSGDAFDRLGEAINAMLVRIEALVSELRLVTDALAHDLRSPVSRLKATIERALQGTRDATALEALGSASDEADGLLRMLTTALQISRAEAGLGTDQFTRFDAATMIADLAEVYGPLAEDQGFAIETAVPAPFMVRAHRELLGQALANLIDNALKYATGGSHIMLSLAPAGSHVRITVSDDGPGIASDRRGEALRRFGRLDPARTAGGAGLGLSLVATIAHLHGGTFVLEDAEPGLRAVLDVPGADPEPAPA
ncbi:MAG: HAMP domain-containing sensor histidine kinase [Sphingomonadales bacterium]